MSTPKLNILMVDDQPAKLLTYEAMLADLGENLITAHTAREALFHLLQEDIAVVLMDVNMPELDGFELAAMIREHPRCRKTSIIFVSAIHLTDVDRLRGYENGAVDYVSVPVVPEILRAKVGVFVDLYRKTTQLEHLNRTLEERVHERTAELEASVAQLRLSEGRLRQQGDALAEADRRKNEFLAMLAHELRNPLQPIRTALELARKSKADSQQQAWGRDIIERQVNQLVRLVDDLLDASRISSGKLELRRSPADFSRIIAGAVESVTPLAEVKRQHLSVELPEAPIPLDCDAVRLTQVFLNLLNNAVKYTPVGGHISLTAARAGDEVVVRVTDDGAGLAEHDRTKIFEMFYQGTTDPGDTQGGLGLGLALVRQLVDLHGGSVRAVSAGRGHGSEFCVRLPAPMAEKMPETATAPVDARPVPPMGRRILIVDDNRDAADSLAAMLRLAGNDVNAIYDGADAVATLTRYRPEMILMDLGMPKLDGYQAARAIRKEPRGKDVILIALTGWGEEENRRLTREAGFDLHLVKPVIPAELLALLVSFRRAPASSFHDNARGASRPVAS